MRRDHIFVIGRAETGQDAVRQGDALRAVIDDLHPKLRVGNGRHFVERQRGRQRRRIIRERHRQFRAKQRIIGAVRGLVQFHRQDIRSRYQASRRKIQPV